VLPQAIELQVVTPEQLLVHEEVHEAQIPGLGGYLGILPGHAPLLSELQMGELSYRKGNHWSYLTVFRGFVEVLPERIIVLAEVGERGEEIDVERAQRARQRAEEHLKHPSDPDVDWNRAQVALQRAVIRIQVAGKAGAGPAGGALAEESAHVP